MNNINIFILVVYRTCKRSSNSCIKTTPNISFNYFSMSVLQKVLIRYSLTPLAFLLCSSNVFFYLFVLRCVLSVRNTIEKNKIRSLEELVLVDETVSFTYVQREWLAQLLFSCKWAADFQTEIVKLDLVLLSIWSQLIFTCYFYTGLSLWPTHLVYLSSRNRLTK